MEGGSWPRAAQRMCIMRTTLRGRGGQGAGMFLRKLRGVGSGAGRRRGWARVVLGAALAATLGSLAALAQPASERPLVYSAVVDAMVHPVSAGFMVEAMDRADADRAALIVFTLRTPGGLLDSTRTIVSRMLASRTPVAIFVGPSGQPRRVGRLPRSPSPPTWQPWRRARTSARPTPCRAAARRSTRRWPRRWPRTSPPMPARGRRAAAGTRSSPTRRCGKAAPLRRRRRSRPRRR